MNKKQTLIHKISHIFPSNLRKKIYETYLKILWGIYYKKYLKIIESNHYPNKELIQKLIYSWGNSGYSAQQDYIESLIHHANSVNNLIFECGSGLSTLIVGAIAKKNGVKMISIEHHPKWAAKVQTEIKKYKLTNNQIFLSNLINYGDFDWYDIDNINISDIDLCICDAPPGNTFGGRKGFLYLFKDKVHNGTIILVDDIIREAEQKMIEEWSNIIPFDIIQKGENDPHAILMIKNI